MSADGGPRGRPRRQPADTSGIVLRLAFKSAGVDMSSRPWGFELLHAYISHVTSIYKCWLAMDLLCLDMGFETLNLKL